MEFGSAKIMDYFLLGSYFLISYQDLLIHNQGPGLALTNTDCTDNFPKDFSMILVKSKLYGHLTGSAGRASDS